ncbi:MAG: UPF0175 family protein [Anaerolineales bacterium]|nr:UPF0175 family protein [Anaerolineales bacterium]
MSDVTFTVNVSPDLLTFGVDQEQVRRNINEWLVLSLFTDNRISSGKAAKLLNISRLDFLALLRKRGIAYIDFFPQELEEEFDAVNSLKIEKSK